MTFRFIYSNFELSRIIQSVLIDKRASIPEIKNKIGADIKIFIESQIQLFSENDVFYKIESDSGNLAGYFSIKKVREGVGSMVLYELRPNFADFELQISNQVANFIMSNEWLFDT